MCLRAFEGPQYWPEEDHLFEEDEELEDHEEHEGDEQQEVRL